MSHHSDVSVDVTNCFETDTKEICDVSERVIVNHDAYEVHVVGGSVSTSHHGVKRVLTSQRVQDSIDIEGAFMHCEIGTSANNFSLRTTP